MHDEYLDYILDQLSFRDGIRVRKMFGGYGLYCDELFFALISEDVLYFKADAEASEYFASKGSEAFSYTTKHNKVVKVSYWKVPIEIIEDTDLLKDWFQKAMHSAISARKTKR